MKITGRITAALLSALMLTLVFVSCRDSESQDVPNGFISAANDIANYYLYVPDDWVVDTAPGSLMASARENEYGTSNVTMLSYTDDEGRYKDVPAYWEAYKEDLAGSFDKVKDNEGNVTGESSFKMDGEGSNYKVDGVDAVKYVYTATLADVELKYAQLIAKKDDVIYIFTYTTTPEGYDADTVDSIINNIKFK